MESQTENDMGFHAIFVRIHARAERSPDKNYTEILVKKPKSKPTENETVCLERKMFWKVDKHKQNDQNKKNTCFISFPWTQNSEK